MPYFNPDYFNPAYFNTGATTTVFDLNAGSFPWSAKAEQNILSATLNTKAGASWSAKALQNRQNTTLNTKALTGWSTKATQNKQTTSHGVGSFSWVDNAVTFVNSASAVVFDLLASSFGFTARSVQLRQTTAHALGQLRLTAQSLTQTSIVALATKAMTSWSAKTIQMKQTVMTGVASFLFTQQAVNIITDAVVDIGRRLRSRYSHFRQLLKQRRY